MLRRALRIGIGLLGIAFIASDARWVFAAAVGGPSDGPASSVRTKWIAALADPSHDVRDKAAAALRARGQASVPDLEATARGSTPTAPLARTILRDIEMGLSPSLLPETRQFLTHYVDADPLDKATVPYKIADSGTAGLRAIVCLYRKTGDRDLLGPLSEHRHEAASLMLGLGMAREAEQIIGPPSDDDLPNAQGSIGDAAAFLLFSGKLVAARGDLQSRPLDEKNAGRRYLLDRAAGDLAAARADAQKIPNWPRLLDEILFRQHDWRTLAARLEAGPDDLFTGAERFGFLCRCYGLLGDGEHAAKTSARLVALADVDFQTGGNDPINIADELFMCGFPDRAIDLLIAHREWGQASWYLPARLRFDESLALVDTVKTKVPAGLPTVQANSLKALRFIGKGDSIRKMILNQAAAKPADRNDDPLARAAYTAHDCGFPVLAAQFLPQALARQEYRGIDSTQMVFFSLGVEDWAGASLWFHYLRRHYGDEHVDLAVRDVLQTFDGTIDAAALARLGQSVLREASDDGSPQDGDRFARLGELLASHNQRGAAAGFLAHVEQAANSAEAMRRAGDFQADRENWGAAEDDYAVAFELDPLQAAPLYLRGWALTHLGRANEGRQLMERAEMLPLDDGAGRKALFDAMVRHHLLVEARRELARLLDLNGSEAYESTEALRWAAADAEGRKDFATAADLVVDAFLPMQRNGAGFLQPLAYLEVPAMHHAIKARALLLAAKVGGAMEEARAAAALVPLDADMPAQLIGAFEEAGHKPEADELYRDRVAVYRGLVDRYRESAPARQLTATFQLRTGRDLPTAHQYAAAAVALEPESPELLRTLAEVEFAQRDVAAAVADMRRCVKLLPDSGRYREQLTEYEAALGRGAK